MSENDARIAEGWRTLREAKLVEIRYQGEVETFTIEIEIDEDTAAGAVVRALRDHLLDAHDQELARRRTAH